MKIWIFVCVILVIIAIPSYSQTQYSLLVGDFENKSGVDNPLLDYLTDTIDFLFSRSKIAEIEPVSSGLRSAYLARVKKEQPKADITQLSLLSAEYANADAVLLGNYTKSGTQWSMNAHLYIKQDKKWLKEDIQLTGADVYRLLDNLVIEVAKQLKMPQQYVPPSSKTEEAYELYRQGHKAFYNFDTMGAINYFQNAIELDPHLAIAYAELGIIYLTMLNNPDKASLAVAEAMKNRQYASKQEQFVVTGLESYFISAKPAWRNESVTEMPRMREDTTWDEPWLRWCISMTVSDIPTRNREYKQWLRSAIAYSKADFYGIVDLINAGTNNCIVAYYSSKDTQFLDASFNFIQQAKEFDANDIYDEAWMSWEFANIYEKMNKITDAQKYREQWLQLSKNKPVDKLSHEEIDDIANKCLAMGAIKDAIEFAKKAVELESEPSPRTLYLVTLGDTYSASGEINEAFDSYIEAFNLFKNGSAGTTFLAQGGLSRLAILIDKNPELKEAKKTKFDEIMETIKQTDQQDIRDKDAGNTLTVMVVGPSGIFDSTRDAQSPFVRVRDFCIAMGDTKLPNEIIRSMLKAETTPDGQLALISYLIHNGSAGEQEKSYLSSPEFIKSIIALNKPFLAGWLYEVIGDREKAIEAYQRALKSPETDKTFMRATGALISLKHNMGVTSISQPYVYLEAEDAEKITPYFEIAQTPEASGGKYIWAPNTLDGSKDNKGEAEYIFEIKNPGTYRIVSRVMNYSSRGNEINMSIDNSDTKLLCSGIWSWESAYDSFALPAGKHRLILHSKYDGVKIDCIVLYREK